MKNKLISLWIIGMFLFTSLSVFAGENVIVAYDGNSNNQVSVSYSFIKPVVKQVKIDDDIYNQLVMKDCFCAGNPGEPSLPARGAYILLPQRIKVNKITVTYDERVYLGAGYIIEPVAKSVPLSMINSSSSPTPNKAIYSSSNMFPSDLSTNVGTYSFRGYNILVLKLHPVQYIPSTGELFYYPKLTVNVKTTTDVETNILFRGLEKDRSMVLEKVDNPLITNTYTTQKTNRLSVLKDDYDLVIITDESLMDDFKPLKQTHDTEGLHTLIYSVQDIYNNYPGVDKPEQIRNFIIDTYNNHGIDYVLLGGDVDIIPVRELLARGVTVTSPADLYYGCLSGTWNKPEKPFPSNKDISIGDSGVSISTKGIFSSPEEDYVKKRVGDSSLKWIVNNTDAIYTDITFSFDEPLDLSNVKWLNFFNREQIIESGSGYEITEIFFNSATGDEIEIIRCFPPPPRIHFFSTERWFKHNAEIPLFEDFNWNAVKSIVFRVMRDDDNSQIEIGDTIWMDGIYFSEFRDEYWGEPGEYDLYAEVYVGRACVDDEKDVNNFVSKTIDYISTNRNESYLKEVLMAGEGLGWQYSGGDYLDQLIDGSSKNGYKTVGIPSSKYKITKLYDRNRVWPVSELINRINNNVHIINHDGHSGYNNNMKMQISDVDSLTNSKYCFIYSLGCHAGSFDRDDCIAEHLTVKTGHGAFAGIWNAGYGLGNSSSTDGASQRFIREFWDAVFGENIYSIGKANHDSKEDNNYLIDNEDMKYVYFGLNLFGDPSISFIMPKDKGKTKNVLSNEKPIFFRFIKQILILEQLFLKHPFLKTIVERLT